MKMMPCPCGSTRLYGDCCEPYLLNLQLPQTPVALMRSRYTAYTQANINYIQRTMRGPALASFNYEEAQLWAKSVRWLELKVIATQSKQENPDMGFVEFIAIFSQENQRQYIYERSEFHRIEGCWFYVNGSKLKVNRNDLCICGSGKKYKQCCHNQYALHPL